MLDEPAMLVEGGGGSMNFGLLEAASSRSFRDLLCDELDPLGWDAMVSCDKSQSFFDLTRDNDGDFISLGVNSCAGGSCLPTTVVDLAFFDEVVFAVSSLREMGGPPLSK